MWIYSSVQYLASYETQQLNFSQIALKYFLSEFFLIDFELSVFVQI